ncbi:hypothetical protein C8Q73DRAFT_205973 [Cubamyces lactineus]|nr:hypothetical protein C8Q73DRAFT_205973 [Cubamyces lactineus]
MISGAPAQTSREPSPETSPQSRPAQPRPGTPASVTQSHSTSHSRGLLSLLTQVPTSQPVPVRRALVCSTSTTQTRGRRTARKMRRLGKSVAVRRSLCILGARHIQLGASASSASHPLPSPPQSQSSPDLPILRILLVFDCRPCHVRVQSLCLQCYPQTDRTIAVDLSTPSASPIGVLSPCGSPSPAVSRPLFPGPHRLRLPWAARHTWITARRNLID